MLTLPSHSDVVGMVNLEAAACRTPTITTHETGLWDWEAGGGLLIRPNESDLRQALVRASSWSDTERVAQGEASRDLVKRRYSMDVVGEQWLTLYRDLAGKN